VDLLLLKQLLCTIIKLFTYNELGFRWGTQNAVKAGALVQRPVVLSSLFAVDWYAWQDSNLRPVAPEATGHSKSDGGSNNVQE